MNLVLRGGARIGGQPADVCITDDLVAEHPAPDAQVVDVTGCLVAPALVDIHTHVFRPARTLGIEADSVGVRQGVGTVVDAGSTGARDLTRFRDDVVATQQTHVFAWLNVSRIGLVDNRHELRDLADVDIAAAQEAIEDNRDIIVGIKARMSGSVVGDNGVEPLRRAIELGERVGLPVMIHTGNQPPDMMDCLDLLRPGDVCSHAFHGKPGGILDASGKPRPAVLRAKERGVVFDVGHGEASLNFDVIARARDHGILPDTISTDIHEGNINGPVHSLAVTMSKVLALGFPLADVVRWASEAPARVIGRPAVSDMSPGAPANLTVFRLARGDFEYHDADGNVLRGEARIEPTHLVLDGELHVV